jgi:hypothetical protein
MLVSGPQLKATYRLDERFIFAARQAARKLE